MDSGNPLLVREWRTALWRNSVPGLWNRPSADGLCWRLKKGTGVREECRRDLLPGDGRVESLCVLKGELGGSDRSPTKRFPAGLHLVSLP